MPKDKLFDRAKRHFPACLVFILLFSFAGCSSQRIPSPPPSWNDHFPTGARLKEGDIVLARSYGLIGALFATQSQPGGKYSHGAMLYQDGDGRLMVFNYRPAGMETCSPGEFFSRYNRLALVRFRGDLSRARAPKYAGQNGEPSGPAALSAAARSWLAQNTARRIPPDYRLDHDNHDAMFCLELPSAAYRDCGLPDPFFRARRADGDPILSAANRLFNASVLEIRSPSSALDNPDFHLVDEWIRPEYDLRDEAVNEEVMRIMADEIGEGFRPRRPNPLGRLKLKQIFALYHLVTRFMFWRPKQDLPDFINSGVVENAYMLYNYAAKGKKLAKARVRRETEAVPARNARAEEGYQNLAGTRRIVRESMVRFRDRYLVK
ncbi:MAG: hypothetical protein LBE84_01220 [Planctomycetota bacterium]|nr:hypothetical protein [Planctomycetota bacterium]